MQVELVSPDAILFSGEADVVLARASGGDIAFLRGHAPFLGTLDVGVVTIRSDGSDLVAAVHGGFVEVRDDKVTILSDVAEMSDDIDVERARRAKQAAEARLGGEHDDEAGAELKRADVRLEAAGGGPSSSA